MKVRRPDPRQDKDSVEYRNRMKKEQDLENSRRDAVFLELRKFRCIIKRDFMSAFRQQFALIDFRSTESEFDGNLRALKQENADLKATSDHWHTWIAKEARETFSALLSNDEIFSSNTEIFSGLLQERVQKLVNLEYTLEVKDKEVQSIKGTLETNDQKIKDLEKAAKNHDRDMADLQEKLHSKSKRLDDVEGGIKSREHSIKLREESVKQKEKRLKAQPRKQAKESAKESGKEFKTAKAQWERS